MDVIVGNPGFPGEISSPKFQYPVGKIGKKEDTGYPTCICKNKGFKETETEFPDSQGECHGKFNAAEENYYYFFQEVDLLNAL